MHPTTVNRAAAGCAAGLVALLSGCGNANPEDVEWTKVKTQRIVAVDDSADVYVTGGLFKTESEQRIDYKFAQPVEGGGLHQRMLSDLYGEIPGQDPERYPGAKVVTIYQDVDRPKEEPRIEIYECSPPELKGCVTPDGRDMGLTYFRVDIHVPNGAVVEPDTPAESEEGEG